MGTVPASAGASSDLALEFTREVGSCLRLWARLRPAMIVEAGGGDRAVVGLTAGRWAVLALLVVVSMATFAAGAAADSGHAQQAPRMHFGDRVKVATVCFSVTNPAGGQSTLYGLRYTDTRAAGRSVDTGDRSGAWDCVFDGELGLLAHVVGGEGAGCSRLRRLLV